MPILVEGVTVVVPRAVLDARWPGGAQAFLEAQPRFRRCADDALAAVTCERGAEAEALLDALEGAGLRIAARAEWVDAAVAWQRMRPERWCAWLELARVRAAGGHVLAARAAGSDRTEVAVPEGWTFADSATRRTGVVALPPAERPLRFVRREPSAAVYVDRFNGEEVRVALRDPPARLEVERRDGTVAAVTVEVVREWASIEVGLMHREALESDAGMLFAFPELHLASFWMKNTRIPLDMLFADAAGVIVGVSERVAPMTTRTSGPAAPCRFVLEVNAGWCAAHGVGVGDRLRVAGLALRR
jgi:uncharacterized membrane protein (UPF0127 family)